MFFRIVFKLKQFSKRLSVRAGFYALFAVVAALIAVVFAPLVPKEFADNVGGEAVDSILNVLATSMLVVVTFSLSTMVAAFASAAQSATPRATRLLVEDSRAQTALSVFLGGFIYSIVSLIALSTSYYGSQGRAILLMFTILILATIVLTMIRWIDQLASFGRIPETISRVRDAGIKSMREEAGGPLRQYPEGPTRSRHPTGDVMLKKV